ncbi:MAG: hypothetical protein VKM98_04265 [Cyanobacteriota bacterium]|nr:hypothetical protein [Cyanobacteriota bacterium]
MAAAVTGAVAHVGLPKTASTYLQRHYFARLPDIKLLTTTAPFDWPRQLNFVWPANWFWYDDLALAQPRLSQQQRRQRYAARTAKYLRRWRRQASAFAARSPQAQPWLISAEGLCGYAPEVNALHMALLKQAGVSKVVFVCRQQARYAQSLWRQFLLAEDRLARYVSFDELFGAADAQGVVGLDWMPYIQAMDAEFGSTNVLILPYELLNADAPDFFRRLNRFLGLPGDALMPESAVRENPSRTDATYRGLVFDSRFPLRDLPWLRRRLHGLAARIGPWLPRALRQDQPMQVSAAALAALQARYGASNAALETRLGLDLRRFGYY